MKGKRFCRCVLAALIAGVAAGVLIQRTATANLANVLPGIDLWTTPGGGTAFWDFSAAPLPADFFGPGSDPFDGRIVLEGRPLPHLGGPSLFPADTVVERQKPAILPTVGASDTVDIEIVALSLVSTGPITVTENGGLNPQLWDVEVTLSSSYSQTTGTMNIRHECSDGGTFDSVLPVRPKFTFIHQSGALTVVYDFGDARVFTVANGRWVHLPDASFNVVKVPEGAVTDGDRDGSADPPLPPTSNFSAGIWPLPCNSNDPTTLQLMRLTPQTSTQAAHGLIIAFTGYPTDTDGDSTPDVADNCLDDSNPLQEDSDDNGFGDACQTDICLPLVLRNY